MAKSTAVAAEVTAAMKAVNDLMKAYRIPVEAAMGGAERVLLVDCSIQMGVCATLLDLRPATTLHDALAAIDDDTYNALDPLQWPLPAGRGAGVERLFAAGGFFTESRKARFIAPAVPAEVTAPPT